MVNQGRGESSIQIDGEPHTLCLTLGALAEIETALGVADMGGLGERLAQVGFADMVSILGALLRGGGHDVTDETHAA